LNPSSLLVLSWPYLRPFSTSIMETTSDSSENNPIPKKRTVPAGHRMRPLSSEESPVISSPSLTPTKRQHRREKPVRRLEGDSTQRQKPRLPKPKPRRVPPAQSASTTIPTTLPARTKYQEKEEPPPPTSPPKSVPKTKKRPPKQTTTAETTGIEPVLETASGKGDGVNELRIRDILHAFQDDVVTVKSSQRNKWQEKLDAIQSQLLFPELDHRKFETVSGGDGGSVPSNWKSAASLIPRDPTPGGGRDDSRTRDQDFAIFKWFRGIQYLSSFSSGIVSGLLLWKALFAVIQITITDMFYHILIIHDWFIGFTNDIRPWLHIESILLDSILDVDLSSTLGHRARVSQQVTTLLTTLLTRTTYSNIVGN